MNLRVAYYACWQTGWGEKFEDEVCFKHAVKLATRGNAIRTTIEPDDHTCFCPYCARELEEATE